MGSGATKGPEPFASLNNMDSEKPWIRIRSKIDGFFAIKVV